MWKYCKNIVIAFLNFSFLFLFYFPFFFSSTCFFSFSFFLFFSPPYLSLISIFALLFSFLLLELYLHFSFFFLFFSSISSLRFSFFLFFSSHFVYSRAFKKLSLFLTHKWVRWVPFFSSHHHMSSLPRLRWVSFALPFFFFWF